jgi:hypothetical protein
MIVREPNSRASYPDFLIFLIWPLMLPIHLVRSRGVEGLVLFVGFVGMYVAPYFVQVFIWAKNAS